MHYLRMSMLAARQLVRSEQPAGRGLSVLSQLCHIPLYNADPVWQAGRQAGRQKVRVAEYVGGMCVYLHLHLIHISSHCLLIMNWTNSHRLLLFHEFSCKVRTLRKTDKTQPVRAMD